MWAGLEAALDRTERDQAAKFVFDQDRRAYIAAHALLRYALSASADIEPGAWRFAIGVHGKPFLQEQPDGLDLRFSLSHTRGMAAVALAQGVDVGVDVEARERVGQFDLAVADAHFAPDEAALLRALPSAEERQERFLALWTLKEAVVKATGRGVSQPLAGFSIGFDPLRVTLRDAPADGATAAEQAPWRLAHWPLAGWHLAAAARWPRAGNPVFEHSTAELSDVFSRASRN